MQLRRSAIHMREPILSLISKSHEIQMLMPKFSIFQFFCLFMFIREKADEPGYK